MHKLFDRFDKEDFYMIQFKNKEYGRELNSFETLTFLWIIVGSIFWIGILAMVGSIFPQKTPISYICYLFFAFFFLWKCLFIILKRSRRKKNYELRMAKNYFMIIFILGVSLVELGIIMWLDGNQQLVYSNFSSSELIKIANSLFFVQPIIVLASTVILFIGIKLGFYREEEKKKKNIEMLNVLTIAITPVLASVGFIINLIQGGSGTALFSIASFVIFAGFLASAVTPQFYMIYYLRRRFPEDYLDDRAKEEDHEN